MLRKLVFAALVCAALACHPCPPCNQAQCNAAPCTASDPYYCVSGPSAGGCGPNSDTWNNTKLCTACCDTSNCSSTRFSCGTCTQAQCESPNRCSLLAPYMCTNGSSSWGCATTANFWPAQHMCDGCCDVTSCVSSCTPCTVQQCQANPCSPSFPYVCTAGPLKNGCSNSSSYFPDQSQCFACCDASACATPAPQTPAPPTRDPAA